MREIATEMSLGLRTVEKEWAMARAWMRSELRSVDPPEESNGSVLSSAKSKASGPGSENG